MTSEDLAEALLHSLSFEDILEMNDLSEETALSILLDTGRIKYPDNIIQEFERLYDGVEED